METEQSIIVPLSGGCRVSLYSEVEIDRNDGIDVGGAREFLFEDYVECHIPEIGLLEFRDSDVGLAEFHDMLNDADGIEVIWNI